MTSNNSDNKTHWQRYVPYYPYILLPKPRHDNELAFITGASSGIGKATAEELHDVGFKLVLMARREQLLKQFQDSHTNTHYYKLDVGNKEQVQDVFSRAINEHGLPDVLVTSAGQGLYLSYAKLTEERKRKIMDVNFYGTEHCIQQVLPGMFERGTGHVIAIASLAPFAFPYGHSYYTISKAAVRSLIRSLSLEKRSISKGEGVHLSSLLPGPIDTALFDNKEVSEGRFPKKTLKKMVGAERVSSAVRYLIDHPERREIIVPRYQGIIATIDHLFPRLAERLVYDGSRPD